MDGQVRLYKHTFDHPIGWVFPLGQVWQYDGTNKEELDVHLETNHRVEREETPIAGDFVLTEIFCKSCEFTAAPDENQVSASKMGHKETLFSK